MLTALIALLLGAFGWSFAEYALHNWVFHARRGRTRLGAEHLRHHARTSYFTPTWRKLITAVWVTAILAPLSLLALSPAAGIGFVAGFVGGWVAYEVVHRRLHTHPPRGPYGRWARRHHLHHHFHSPHMNHGVTSPLWDLVFGTYERPDRVTVPRRQVMNWLCDPETGEVREAYAADFRIGRRRGRASNVPAPAA